MAVRGHFPTTTGMLLGVLLFLGWAQHAPGSLEVRMDEKAQIVFLNANITIPCLLSDYGSQLLNISVIGVRWYLKRSNSTNEDIVFEYKGGKWTQFRPGANISMSGLRRGNASLHLPHIQLQEGGEYRCEIIIPPNRVQGTARLDIMAHPSSNLLPQQTLVEEKKVYTGECTVAGFYLQSVLIFWENVVQGTHSLDVDNSEYIYKSSIWKNNGTFNATSSFILFPILEDNATIYLCVNKSLLIPLQNTTTWTVTGLSSNVVWTILVSILLVICLYFFVWFEFFRKGKRLLGVMKGRNTLRNVDDIK